MFNNVSITKDGKKDIYSIIEKYLDFIDED